jgi:UDP-N-acetylmuramoyl-L-alanyl-D-glutamate--2,6-diaminopimelate ligase
VPFINDAVRNGAKVIIAETESPPEPFVCQVPVIRVKDLYKKTGSIASRFYSNPSAAMSVIGITGTNGKTTVSHLLASSLTDPAHGMCGLIGTLGYAFSDNLTPGQNTTPEPVALQSLLAHMHNRHINRIVLEVSSHGLDQYRVGGITFDMAVFTNLSRDHLDYHITFENYAITKQRLFTEYHINKAVVNIDDQFGSSLIDKLQDNVKVVGYTLDKNRKHEFSNKIPIVSGAIKNISLGKMTMELNSPWGSGELTTSLFGRFNAYNILAALSAICMFEYSVEDAIERLSKCKNVSGRMECFKTENSPCVIVDYAHTPDALEQVLSVLRSTGNGKVFCVFGCGGDRDKGKRPEMGTVAERFADSIYLTSDNPRNEKPELIMQDIADGISSKELITFEPDRKLAIQNAIKSASDVDIVLVAGKGHENYQEVSGMKKPFRDQKIIADYLRQDK